MKHLIKPVLLTLIYLNVNTVYGLTICAKNGTYVGVLMKEPDGKVVATNSETKAWKLSFDYKGSEKIVTGLAACNEIDGTVGEPITNLYTDYVDEGNYCWCKMEPVKEYIGETGLSSFWVLHSDKKDSATCAKECVSACANSIATDITFRTAVYESIW